MPSEQVHIESVIRTIMTDELSMPQAAFFDMKEEISMDSIAQTELRVLIHQKFGIATDLRAMPMDVTGTLQSIIHHIQRNIAQ